MTSRERAITAALNFAGVKISSGDGTYETLILVITDAIEDYAKAAIEEAHQDWSHALKQAIESVFPNWGDFHEWPATPDIDAVCAWLQRLVEEDRKSRECCKQEREGCAGILKELREDDLKHNRNRPGQSALEIAEARIRARSES